MTIAPGEPKPQPLRLRLFSLVASGMLPLALASLLGTAYLIQDRHMQAQRSALELSRALATAVDSELKAAIDVLQALSLSDELRASNLEPFHRQAQQVAQQRGWRSILLADTSGKLVMSSAQPFTQPVSPVPVDPPSMQLVLRTGQPVVSRAVEGQRIPGTAFAVRVPVFREGRLVNVLSASVSTDQVLDVLQRQNVPSTWVISVFDQDNVRVARTKFNVTARPSPSMQALMDTGASEGMGPTHTLEGVPTFSGFSRLRDSGWTVAVGIASKEVDLALLPLLLSLGMGVLASLALSGYLAWLFARRVSEPIHTLTRAAAALGRGEPVTLPLLGIAELDEVGTALSRAAMEHDAALRERSKSEAEREELLARTAEALRLAEDAGRGKDEFLAVLGHELRNPLAPIATALKLMDIKGDERTQPERQILQRQLGYMVRLVDDLLDVSRITGKRLAIQLEPLRLAAVVERVVETLRPVLARRSMQVRIEPEAARAWVRGDEVRLVQVLNNVLGNAVKFTAATGRIELTMSLHAGQIEVEVKDDGIGMAPQVVAHAFDAFFQAPQEVDRARGGLGLGLAIVKSLVEMHGGSVVAASAGPGQGSTITMRMPCVERPQMQPAPPPPEPVAGLGKVLIVDDNQDAADSTAALLKLLGYDVRVAYHPATAMEIAREFDPDAAILDIGLPGMSGYELAAALRGAPHHFKGLLVALTGYGEQKDKDCALRAGFDAHLTKPTTPEQLLNLLTAHVKTKPTSAAV